MNLGAKIEKALGGNAIFIVYENVPWRERDAALSEDPRIKSGTVDHNEVSRSEAISLLSAALKKDLCYGTKLLGKGVAEEIAKEFVGSHQEGARFYTNSAVPYGGGKEAWSYSPLTAATIDTGVVVREGGNLASVLWVMAFD